MHGGQVCVLSLKSDLVVEILPVSPGAKVPGDDVASLPNSHGLEEPTSAPTLAAPARPMTSPPKTPPADMGEPHPMAWPFPNQILAGHRECMRLLLSHHW